MNPWASNKKEISFKLGRLKIRASYRSSKSFMGRFGGGWNWKLAIQIGGTVIYLALILVEITISWGRDA